MLYALGEGAKYAIDAVGGEYGEGIYKAMSKDGIMRVIGILSGKGIHYADFT